MIFSNTSPFIALSAIGILLKARQQGLIPSFSREALAMKEVGLFFSPDLIARLAKSVGEF